MLTPLEFTERAATRFADNEYQNITEKSFRDFADDIRSAFVAQVAVNVPDYEPGRNYAPGFIIRHSFDGAAPVFLVAMKRGFLPAPTDSELDDNWLPTLSPPSGPALSQAGTVAGMLRAQGSWVPGRLYVLFGRQDQTGALDDVYVRALSAVQLEPTGYTISNDSLAAEPLPVSYDLASDTTSPVEVGAVDAYTKEEANELLVQKGSAQVQQQHTLQLATLGVQASPVMAYLESGDVAGYATLDEALADHRPKTFMRFNVAFLTLTQSNDPLNPGWAAYVDGAGATVQLGNNVVLSLPGSNVDTLLLKNFFIFQAPGTRGGKVKLLATSNGSNPVGYLPLLDGRGSVPLEFNGGAFALRGSYSSLLGTGTVHLFEPFDVSYVSPGLTLVKHEAGAGGGGAGYTDAAAAAAALASLIAGNGQHQGVQVSDVGGVPRLTVAGAVIDVVRLRMPAAGSGNLAEGQDLRDADAGGNYRLTATQNVARFSIVNPAGPITLFDGKAVDFPAGGVPLQGSTWFTYQIVSVDVTQPVFLELTLTH